MTASAHDADSTPVARAFSPRASAAVARATSNRDAPSPLPRAGGGGLTGFMALAAFVLALAGLGVATYLTVVHYAHQPIACNGIGDCEYVNSTKYAEVAGIPVALVGAGAYATMALAVVRWWLRRDAMLLFVGWLVAAGSFAFSMYLTYIELRVIDAICVWCVASASVMTAIFAVLTTCVWLERDAVLGDGPPPLRGVRV